MVSASLSRRRVGACAVIAAVDGPMGMLGLGLALVLDRYGKSVRKSNGMVPLIRYVWFGWIPHALG